MMRSSTGAAAASSGSGERPEEPSAGDARVSISGAGVRYGDLTVFDDIGLTIKDREIVSIVGPSGCGKTTLLRAVDGLTRLNSGTVTIDGKVPDGDAGIDVKADGTGVVTNERLYQLVRQRGEVRDRTFRIQFLDPGAEAFAFTFG